MVKVIVPRNGAVPSETAGAATVVHIHIGEHYVTGAPDVEIATILGSCIAACIRDPRLRIGGMNHFMLPAKAGPSDPAEVNGMRYGQVAMERLINDLLAAGARRERLEVKLFGGATTLDTGLRIGDRNVAFVRHFLAEEGMAIVAEDLGGRAGRRVRYNPVTGQAMRLLIENTRERALFKREAAIGRALAARNEEGTVELFE